MIKGTGEKLGGLRAWMFYGSCQEIGIWMGGPMDQHTARRIQMVQEEITKLEDWSSFVYTGIQGLGKYIRVCSIKTGKKKGCEWLTHAHEVPPNCCRRRPPGRSTHILAPRYQPPD